MNCVAFTDEFRVCVQAARNSQAALHVTEQEHMGFTHCDSGKILAQTWHFSGDVIQVIEFHHHAGPLPVTQPLTSIVHLSDLLCRLRDLGYGYYEMMRVDLAAEDAWPDLVKHYPALATVDLARLTLDIDGAMDEIVELVDEVFARPQQVG